MKTQKGYKKREPVDIIDAAGNNRTVSHRTARLSLIARSCADGNEVRRDHRKLQLENRSKRAAEQAVNHMLDSMPNEVIDGLIEEQAA